jgi:tetratricopeptide (TPR) repeat protein
MGDVLEPEGPVEAERDAAFETTSAAVGLALERAGRSRRKGDVADAFLQDQRVLVGKQLHHLDQQFRRLKLQIWSDRLRLALQGLTILAVVLLLAGVGMMAWQASRADGVVIEAFGVPPDLAAKGWSGQALANRIEDRLNRMQADTVTDRPGASYASDWGRDIKVEIPETGVSVGELERLLRRWLGHERSVGGELVRTADGLSLSIRTEAGGQEVAGTDADMSGLIQRAAEVLYEQTQPYRYAMFLEHRRRYDEAKRVLAALSETGPKSEQAFAFTALSFLQDDPVRGLALARQALALNPRLALAWNAVAIAAGQLGDAETQLGAWDQLARVVVGKDHGFYGDAAWAAEVHIARAWTTGLRGDYSGCTRENALAAAAEPRAQWTREDQRGEAFCLALAHEPSRARAFLGGVDDIAVTRDLPGEETGFNTSNYQLERTREDWDAALKEIQGIKAALQARPGPSNAMLIAREIDPTIVDTLVWAGRLDEAQALADTMPLDSQHGLTARGLLARARGDVAASDAWFARAQRMAPHAFTSWSYKARAQLERGELDGAIATVRQGLPIGPRYAEFQFWLGEALRRQGKSAEALTHFEDAAKLAPRWGRLNLKWAEALAALGRMAEARAHLASARGMDLTASDRAELAALKF